MAIEFLKAAWTAYNVISTVQEVDEVAEAAQQLGWYRPTDDGHLPERTVQLLTQANDHPHMRAPKLPTVEAPYNR